MLTVILRRFLVIMAFKHARTSWVRGWASRNTRFESSFIALERSEEMALRVIVVQQNEVQDVWAGRVIQSSKKALQIC
jgi:hypothetical protein